MTDGCEVECRLFGSMGRSWLFELVDEWLDGDNWMDRWIYTLDGKLYIGSDSHCLHEDPQTQERCFGLHLVGRIWAYSLMAVGVGPLVLQAIQKCTCN